MNRSNVEMQLKMGDDTEITITSEAMIISALNRLDEHQNSFAILFKSDDYFIQTAFAKNGSVIEKQEGGIDNHYQAINAHHFSDALEFFTPDQVHQAFISYWNGNSNPEYLKWKQHIFETQSYRTKKYLDNFMGRINKYYDAIVMKTIDAAVLGFVLFVLCILGLIIFNEFVK